MTRKTEEAYTHALRYVHENLFTLQCGAIITDYECAMRKAIRNVVPDIKMLGCWFHFAQAIRRKVASLGDLFEIVRTTEKARDLYYKIICLALLPHGSIERTFNELALESLQLSKSFTPFIKYFQRQWIDRVGPKNFSVFLEETRTTCSAEGYNGKLGKNFRTHPNFLVFIESLQWEELYKSNAFEKHIGGTLQTQPKKKYRERAALIREESVKFTIPNKTNAQLFLNRMTNLRNNIFPQHFESFEDIVSFSDEAEEMLDYLNDATINGGAEKVNTGMTVKASQQNTTEVTPVASLQNVRTEKNLSENSTENKVITSRQKVRTKNLTSEKVEKENDMIEGPMTRSKKTQLAKEGIDAKERQSGPRTRSSQKRG